MRKILLASAAMALLGAVTAQAADVTPQLPEEPIYQMPEPQPIAAASGWYIRGDVGYAWNRSSGTSYYRANDVDDYVSFTSSKLRGSYSVGGGVGYQATERLRGDVTLDYFGKANFVGSTRGGCGVALDCISTDLSSMTAYSLLANAYVDLYKWGRFTAYAGGGLGGTYVKWNGLDNESCDATDSTSCDPHFYHGGAASWRFTYALMAGASVDLTCNLKGDLGYRYRHVSGGKMFQSLNSSGIQGYDHGFDSHEVRGGLRYSFGGCETQAAYIEPAPVYTHPVYK